MMFFSPYFWIIIYGILAIVAAAEAARHDRPRAAVFLFCGTIAGLALAIFPLFWWMEAYEQQTGYSAGNAGVLLVCTLPTFPPLAAYVGYRIGAFFDERRKEKREEQPNADVH